MKSIKIDLKIKIGVFFIVMGFIGAAIFIAMASTLNPWSMKLPHLDSAVWLRCAVGMKQGETLYVDVWDHKGLVLFAIQYLGLTLTPHSLTGIWILECLCIFLLLWSFYLIAGLISERRLVCFLASVLSLHSFYYFYQQGNCVEEWALPLIGFSLYFFVKYLKTERTVSMFFASTFSSKMQIDFLKVAWGISPVLHFPLRHSFRCRRGAVAGIQSLLVTDM